jgi:hypothetical protein
MQTRTGEVDWLAIGGFVVGAVVLVANVWGQFSTFVPTAIGQGVAYAFGACCAGGAAYISYQRGWFGMANRRAYAAGLVVMGAFVGSYAMQSGISDWATLLFGSDGSQTMTVSGWEPEHKSYCAHYKFEGVSGWGGHKLCAPSPEGSALRPGATIIFRGRVSALGVHVAQPLD